MDDKQIEALMDKVFKVEMRIREANKALKALQAECDHDVVEHTHHDYAFMDSRSITVFDRYFCRICHKEEEFAFGTVTSSEEKAEVFLD